MLSKIYSHRTNASRAARAAGLTKAPLIAVAGGYQFELPPSDGAMYAAANPAPQEAIDQIAAQLAQPPAGWDTVEGGAKTVEQWDADATPFVDAPADSDTTAPNPNAASTSDENEPDVPDARAAHTVVNGAPREMTNEECAAISRTEASLERLDAALAVAESVTAKPSRQRRAKAAKAPNPAKRTKAARKARAVVDGPTKRGTKAYADRMAARRRAGMNKRGITKMVIKKITGRWTPTSELLKMTGWQPTTLRGALSGYHRDHGIEIKGETRDGERYYLVAR